MTQSERAQSRSSQLGILLIALTLASCGGGVAGGGDTATPGAPPVATPEPPVAQSPPVSDPVPTPEEPATTTARLPVVSMVASSPVCDAADERSVALVVDQKFGTPLARELTRLGADISADLGVCVRTLTVQDGDSAQSIRGSLQALRSGHGLQGAVLIGDVPTVRFGDYAGFPNVSPYLTDSYYEVLNDRYWVDANSNGVFDRTFDLDGDGAASLLLDVVSDARSRDIWTGRLTPPKSGAQDLRVEQLRRYLGRNHAYRTGTKSYEPRMLYMNSAYRDNFPNDGSFGAEVQQKDAEAMYRASRLFVAPPSEALSSIWNDEMATQRQSWRQAIQAPVTYTYVNTHGTSQAQSAVEANAWTDFTSADLARTPYNGLLLDFVSCSNADFSDPNYFAGNALFLGQSLAVRAFSSVVLVTGRGAAPMSVRLLGSGLTLGEIKKFSAAIDSYVIVGDPTLRLKPRSGLFGEIPVVAELTFPALSVDYVATANPKQSIRLRNAGDRSISIHRSEQILGTSWQERGTLNRSIPIPNANVGRTGIEPYFVEDAGIALPETIAPGASVLLNVYFVKAYAGSRSGVYRWMGVFDSDDPTMPVFAIKALQKLE